MSEIRQVTIRREFRNIRQSFMNIARAFHKIAPALSDVSGRSTASPVTKSGRRKPRLTQSHRRALKLQGRYMGTMRGLSVRSQAKVKAARRDKGIRAAIALAGRLASK